jgi:hypothetical protein
MKTYNFISLLNFVNVKITAFAFFLICLLLISCSPDDKVINNINENYKILYSTDTQISKLVIFDISNQTIVQNDVFYSANNKNLEGKVTKMAVYGSNLYLIMPDAFKIKIVDRYTYKEISDISFAALQYKPKDIAFANATDAYIIFSNSGKISQWDLYNMKNAQFINLLTKPQAILISSYYLVVTDIATNSVSIFDSRNMNKIASVPVGDYPYYLTNTANGSKVAVVSLGKGKIDTSETKTAAQITLINLSDGSVAASTPIGGGMIKAEDQFPQGISASPYDLAFIPTTKYLIAFNMRTPAGIFSLGTGNYRGIEFNSANNVILYTMLKASQPVLATANSTNGRISQTYNLPVDNILTFISL